MKTKRNETSRMLVKTYGIERSEADQQSEQVPVYAYIRSEPVEGDSPCETVPEWVFFKAQSLKAKVNDDPTIRKWIRTEAKRQRDGFKRVFGQKATIKEFTYWIPTESDKEVSIRVI